MLHTETPAFNYHEEAWSNSTPTPGVNIHGSGSGTSASAPLWAGIAADINQSLLAAHVAPLGHFNESIYQLYHTPQIYVPYHDITTGTNLYYKAVPGYDMATGVGTPDAWNIARDLQSAPALAAQLLQNAGFEAGARAWQETSQGGYELISTSLAHTGTHSAYLCGYPNCNDPITQTVTLPTSTRNVVLSYWTYIGRSVATSNCTDTFQAYLRVPAAQGTTDIPLHALCSNDANGWVQFSFNILPQLMPYFGKPVQIGFNMRDLPPQRKESRH